MPILLSVDRHPRCLFVHEVQLIFTPMSHGIGFLVMFLGVASAATSYVMAKFDLDRFFHTLQRQKVNVQTFCIAPHSQKLTTEAVMYGSHSFYTANTPYLPLPCKFARRRCYWVTSGSSHLMKLIYRPRQDERMKISHYEQNFHFFDK